MSGPSVQTAPLSSDVSTTVPLPVRIVWTSAAQMPPAKKAPVGISPSAGRCGVGIVASGGVRTWETPPRAQYDAERRIRDRRLTWLAIYHSHPGGGTDPSPLDIAFSARRPGVAHLIVAVDRPTTHDAIAAYRAVDGHIEQVELRIGET